MRSLKVWITATTPGISVWSETEMYQEMDQRAEKSLKDLLSLGGFS